MNGQMTIGMETRLRDLTVGEFLSLLRSAGASVNGRYVTGVRKIADYLGVDRGQVQRATRTGRFGPALRNVGGRWQLDTVLYERTNTNQNNSYERDELEAQRG